MTVLIHEKPFHNINGSAKHANWSINWVDDNGKLNNLFKPPTKKEDLPLFKLFVLIACMALQRNNTLYLASICNPGNEMRLGGHEAPPRIISTYLG